ncbi:MAG: glycosyltransferase [Acidobacteriota bacterium]
MQLLASGMRSIGVPATAACNWNDKSPFKYFCDVNLNVRNNIKNYLARTLFAMFAMIDYDIFHFFFGVSLISFWRFHKIDLAFLRAQRKKIIVHFRGSDIRDKQFFQDAEQYWTTSDHKTSPPQQWSRKDQQKNLQTWRRWADTILVSEPCLWDLVPEAVLSPQVVEMEAWKSAKRRWRDDSKEIVIVHAPTDRKKKGTRFVIAACEELRRKKLPIRLELIENRPFSEMGQAYEIADIGVDQMLYGWHGKFSLEMMAMGVPVVCYIREDLKSFREDLPIVNATVSNLANVLETLVLDKERRLRLAEAGPRYVAKYHSLPIVLEQLSVIYGLRNDGWVGREWLNPLVRN